MSPTALNVAPSTVEVKELRKKNLPTTHYKGMNCIKLAKLCKHDGLSTYGYAAALKARHQAFVWLYNSECNTFTPRLAQQIAQQIHRWETAKKVNTKIMQLLLYMVLGKV